MMTTEMIRVGTLAVCRRLPLPGTGSFLPVIRIKESRRQRKRFNAAARARENAPLLPIYLPGDLLVDPRRK